MSYAVGIPALFLVVISEEAGTVLPAAVKSALVVVLATTVIGAVVLGKRRFPR